MTELKSCPFCGSPDLYETYSQEYALGTKNPEIFCNSCKIIFSIEDDSPYMNCEEDYVYRKNKTLEAWNRRATIEPEIVRCKDCEYWNCESICDGFCSEDRMRHDEDFYCGYAERRTDDKQRRN